MKDLKSREDNTICLHLFLRKYQIYTSFTTKRKYSVYTSLKWWSTRSTEHQVYQLANINFLINHDQSFCILLSAFGTKYSCTEESFKACLFSFYSAERSCLGIKILLINLISFLARTYVCTIYKNFQQKMACSLTIKKPVSHQSACRLHQSNISDDREASKKYRSVIQIGHWFIVHVYSIIFV